MAASRQERLPGLYPTSLRRSADSCTTSMIEGHGAHNTGLMGVHAASARNSPQTSLSKAPSCTRVFGRMPTSLNCPSTSLYGEHWTIDAALCPCAGSAKSSELSSALATCGSSAEWRSPIEGRVTLGRYAFTGHIEYIVDAQYPSTWLLSRQHTHTQPLYGCLLRRVHSQKKS